MDDFYQLDAETQAARMFDLATVALSRWHGEFRDLTLVKYRENAVFSVRDSHGARRALRVHRFGYHTDRELLSELQWMAGLATDGIEVPPAIAAADGSPFVIAALPSIPEPRQVDMLGWLDGAPIGNIEDERTADPVKLVPLYFAVGALAARLHQHSSKWQLPKHFSRHAWDEAGLIGNKPFWGEFRNLPSLGVETLGLLDTACARARSDLARIGKTPANYGLIHADLIPENLLFDGIRVAPIDFDDSGFGWHMFELATALYFYIDAPCYAELRDALRDGYRSIRPLEDWEWSRLPLFLLLRSLTYLGWVGTRHETETARELTPMFVERTSRLERYEFRFGHIQLR
jgi:Ser/Thr protein kinase RdoA (MazF antagonist)